MTLSEYPSGSQPVRPASGNKRASARADHRCEEGISEAKARNGTQLESTIRTIAKNVVFSLGAQPKDIR
jgi:hypothetical protein